MKRIINIVTQRITNIVIARMKSIAVEKRIITTQMVRNTRRRNLMMTWP
jgi:hypothetical protein